MSAPGPSVHPTNPFSTRHVRPGAIPFLFPSGTTPELLLDRLEALGGQAQIVGPHGSGKSTLLAALRACLERAGRRFVVVELHDGQRRLPRGAWNQLNPGDLLLVDGYEQLGVWTRWRLGRHCRRRRLGLLVTSHRSLNLPALYRTSVDAPLALRVVGHLLGSGSRPIADAEIAASLARHKGDLREVLFELYDLFEARKPAD